MSTATTIEHPSATAHQSVFGRVLVGVDGSNDAIAAARQAAMPADGPLMLIEDDDVASWIIEAQRKARRHGRRSVRALSEAGGVVDRVVVVSRGLHGLKALGSVSERVAHQVLSSVLVVREAPWQRGEEPEGNEK